MLIFTLGQIGFYSSFSSSSDKRSYFKSVVILVKNVSFATSTDDAPNSNTYSGTVARTGILLITLSKPQSDSSKMN